MSSALIQYKSLEWALKRSNLPLDAIAKTAHVKPEDLESWQRGRGEHRPTFRQAQNLAHALHVPLGYLFLSSPPNDELPLPDLRTIGDAALEKPSPEFLDLLEDVLRKQDWYREHIAEEGAQTLQFINRFDMRTSIERVAQDISRTLGVDDGLRREAPNWEQFLRRFIEAAQEKGILVLRSGVVANNGRRKLSVQEFRGFAISDNVAPLIFLNGQDSKAAQIFTLAHELAHLWIGQSGISNVDISETSISQSKQVEVFCNKVAAELLVPQEQFLANWDRQASIKDNLYALVRKYRVSSLVILRRALDLRLINPQEYRAAYDDQVEQFRSRESRGGEESGGNFYSTLMLRNSGIFTTAIISGVLEGKVMYRDASRLLGVKAKTLQSIADNLGIR